MSSLVCLCIVQPNSDVNRTKGRGRLNSHSLPDSLSWKIYLLALVLGLMLLVLVILRPLDLDWNLLFNHFIEQCLANKKLYIYNIHSLVSLEISIHPWNYHQSRLQSYLSPPKVCFSWVSDLQLASHQTSELHNFMNQFLIINHICYVILYVSVLFIWHT